MRERSATHFRSRQRETAEKWQIIISFLDFLFSQKIKRRSKHQRPKFCQKKTQRPFFFIFVFLYFCNPLTESWIEELIRTANRTNRIEPKVLWNATTNMSVVRFICKASFSFIKSFIKWYCGSQGNSAFLRKLHCHQITFCLQHCSVSDSILACLVYLNWMTMRS